MTGITHSTLEGEANTTSMHRNLNFLTRLSSGVHHVNYEYDGKARMTKAIIDHDEEVAFSYEHTDPSAETDWTETVIAKHNEVQTESQTDNRGNLISVKEQKQGDPPFLRVKNEYDAYGKYKTSMDYATRSDITYTYDPVMKDKISTIVKSRGNNVEGITVINIYNAFGEVAIRQWKGETFSHSYGYTYKDNAARDLHTITIGDALECHPKLDFHKRNSGKIITDMAGNNLFGEYLYYLKVSDHGTAKVSSVRYGHRENGNYNISDNLKYAYDNMENIAAIWENGWLLTRYLYDQLNRVIREDNKKFDRTYLFTYDNNGNILTRCEALFSAEHPDKITPLKLYTYHYDGVYADQLTCINTETFLENGGSTKSREYITYHREGQARGLPHEYRGRRLAWNLYEQLSGVDGTAYTYDGHGKRITKGDLIFTYSSGDLLVKQSNGMEFFYDSGLNGFTCQGRRYLYRKNAQKDITHILDMDSNIVAEYRYDAWGNHSAYSGDGTLLYSPGTGMEPAFADHIGNQNPFRYRSYYFDADTRLYYLTTRYYDPQTGRFINADNINIAAAVQSDTINGLNLYIYCINNPVNLSDAGSQIP
jgi:RHS repeat-associated protein